MKVRNPAGFARRRNRFAPRTVSLKVEQLEDRAVPAVFGNPWPDGSNITLSFAPDGTAINGSASDLSMFLGAPNGAATREEILRAFQTWVANANINIGLVPDSGAGFDTPGEIQGDSRFGDIRIGGRLLAWDVTALATPFNYFNTGSGNVTINNGKTFNSSSAPGSYDLFTVMLQEAGHTLGVGNSTDAASAMYEFYNGIKSGLTAGDIASIRALYGPRSQDALEGTGGNETFATATNYSGPLVADLTTTADVDCFRFTVAAGNPPLTIRLQSAGLSLLLAKVEILDEAGATVAQGAAQDVTSNNLTVTLPETLAAGAYFVRVSSNRADAFGVGSYRLSIGGEGGGGGSGGYSLSGDFGSFNTAAVLPQQVVTVDQRLDYMVAFTSTAENGFNYFRIHAPAAAAGQAVHLIVSVSDVAGLQDGTAAVFDADRNHLTAQVLSKTTGGVVILVRNVQADVDYFVRVRSAPSYSLTIDFTSRDIQQSLGSTGAPVVGSMQTSTLSVCNSQVVHFTLSAQGTSNASIVMTIRKLDGTVVFSLVVPGGASRSAGVFLRLGRYRVEMSILPGSSYTGGTVNYLLYGFGITDPVGVQPVDPTGDPEGGSGDVPPPNENGQTLYWTADSPADGSTWF